MSAQPRAFVIGHPIAHSRSPLIHGHWLAELARPGSYERIDVAPADLPTFLRDLKAAGFVGGNVTLPHKEAALALVDVVTPLARRLGAVNTLWHDPDGRLVGHNTDAHGYVASLAAALGPDWARSCGTALLLGAGGAARAVAAGLLDSGIGRVLIANRSAARAAGLRDLDPARIVPLAWREVGAALPGTDLLVNTTSLGMHGQPPVDLDLAGLPAAAIVSDIVYVPLETALLADARRRGLRTVPGLGMLLHQAVPGFRAWFGGEPRVDGVLYDRIAADITAKEGAP